MPSQLLVLAAAWSTPIPLVLRQPLTSCSRAVPCRAEVSDSDAVSKLLALTEPTDRGIEASEATRAKILSLIESLEARWAGTDAFALTQTPFLLRNTEVAYVGQGSSKRANAAGGKYRGRIGRFLFRTEALFQHVLAPDVAVNVIQFRLLGLIPGQAVLRGTWRRPLDSTELVTLQRNGSRALSPNTIAVDFEAPRVAFGREGRVLNAQFGPTSRVGLDTTYLDERIRICRGAGSGVPFVFRADTCSDGQPLGAACEQWRVCTERPSIQQLPLAGAVFIASATCGSGLLRPIVPRWCGLILGALAVAMLRTTGGIVVDRPTVESSTGKIETESATAA